MKHVAWLLMLFVMATSLAGCIVHTRSSGRGQARASCPPAHYWDGYACVHNNNRNRGRRGGPPVRDHRR
jgi:hypothetical protein